MKARVKLIRIVLSTKLIHIPKRPKSACNVNIKLMGVQNNNNK